MYDKSSKADQAVIARQLSKSFVHNGRATTVLESIDLVVNYGEVVGVIGPSGCGKTTLLRTIAGLEEISAGRLEVHSPSRSGTAPLMGFIQQRSRLLPWRTILQNMQFLSEVISNPRADRIDVSEMWMRRLGLECYGNHFPTEISGGMQQLVLLGMNLAVDVSILLLDEPFSSVDELTREQLLETILPLLRRPGKCALFVTHHVEEAVFISDRILIMGRSPGRILHEIAVAVPEPRDDGARRTVEFFAICTRIRELLKDARETAVLPTLQRD